MFLLSPQTIDGGPTLNPSTYDLLAGIHEVPAEEVVVLPNSANVIMAAEHAAELSDKQVLVAPTTSQQAGLSAAVALESDRTVEENARALMQALTHLRTGAVAQAARDDVGEGLRGGAVDALGVGHAGSAEFLNDQSHGDVAELVNGGVELELHDGGQPAYWWLLAAE